MLATTIERRLEQLTNEAVQTLAGVMYSSPDDQLRVKAASTLLRAYQRARAAGEIRSVAAAPELDAIVLDLLLGTDSRPTSERSVQR